MRETLVRYRRLHRFGVALLLALAPAAAARAQDPSDSRRDTVSERERGVRRQRQGAGFRVGSWRVSGLSEVSGASYSSTPAFEGYWQRGLDRHLVIETSAGFWRRSQSSSSSAGSEEISSYVIPLLTSIKLYPSTGPENQLEPFLTAGVGFTLGVDDRNTVSGGLLGGSGGGTAMIAGVGLKGGAGIEYRFSQAFGLSASAGYQYVRFFDYIGNERTFKGLLVFGGLTYRFQY